MNNKKANLEAAITIQEDGVARATKLIEWAKAKSNWQVVEFWETKLFLAEGRLKDLRNLDGLDRDPRPPENASMSLSTAAN